MIPRTRIFGRLPGSTATADVTNSLSAEGERTAIEKGHAYYQPGQSATVYIVLPGASHSAAWHCLMADATE